MLIFLLILAAVASYLWDGLNVSIILSNLIYHEDIRTKGSGNPGFTNFKRAFGSKWAWPVFFLDIIKTAVPMVVFGLLFHFNLDAAYGLGWQFGCAWSGFFCMLGNCFPCWYKFKGGKGFMVCLTTLLFIDWRAGLIGFAVMAILLLTLKYMSLATMVGMAAGFVMLIIFKASPFWVPVIFCIMVALMILRHHENISRLVKGKENKTYIFGKGKKKQ